MPAQDTFREQLESLHAISVEIAALRELPQVYDRALAYCLALTDSQFGFIDLLSASRRYMDVVAVRGFEPADPSFYDRYRVMPVRRSVFGVTIIEERSYISNDVEHDHNRVGAPPGHPPVHTFLGVPLRRGILVIGMIGVANKHGGYGPDDDRLLSTFANQVAVAIDNARLNERQREMIAGLEGLNRRLTDAERDQVVALERARIAAGLHDRIGQSIFSIGLQLNALLEHDLDPQVAESLRRVLRENTRTAEELRQVIFALAIPGSTADDLTSSIGALLRDIARENGLKTDLVTGGVPAPGVAAVHAVLYSVVKEALANVVRHAQASRVLVSIRYEPDRVDVVVQDDGVGAPDLVLGGYTQSLLHFGLRNMHRQVTDLGGTLAVENGDESGLVVRASIPVDSGEERPECAAPP